MTSNPSDRRTSLLRPWPRGRGRWFEGSRPDGSDVWVQALEAPPDGVVTCLPWTAAVLDVHDGPDGCLITWWHPTGTPLDPDLEHALIEGPFDEQEALELLAGLLAALAVLHAEGAVVGNLDLQSVLMSPTGPYLLDCGLDPSVPGGFAEPDAPRDAAADLFALGCLVARTTGRVHPAELPPGPLRRALDALVLPRPQRPTAAAVLEQGADTLWLSDTGFRPGLHRWVDLSRKPVLRSLLAALAPTAALPPGRSLPRQALIEAVWPGQRFVGSTGRNRLNVALSTLRRLGLQDFLVFDGHGHRLREGIQILGA